MPLSPTDRLAVEPRQLAGLRSLLATILPTNPFWSRKLADVDVDAALSSLESFSRLVPFTTKAELLNDQSDHPPYGTNLTWPLHRYTRYSQTSGTTRAPLRWLDTPESWSWMLGQWQRVLVESGVQSGDRILFAFSFGPFLGFWTAFEAAARMGCLCLPGGGLSSAARLHVMRDNAVNVLCCTPTYAIRLAESAGEAGVDLHALGVKAIVVGGEPGAGIPATRAAIESLWRPARLYDHYGMTEVGPVSFECPARQGVLHVIESAFYAEVIDPSSGGAVAPGSTGELVLTPLGRTGMPLLRYRTGDLVRPSTGVCACGCADVALEGGIIGRTDDMVVVRGVNVFPTAVEQILRGCVGVAEYRVEVTRDRGMVELRLIVEPTPAVGDRTELAGHVAEALRAALNLRVPVVAVEPGALPRFEMKARRWCYL